MDEYLAALDRTLRAMWAFVAAGLMQLLAAMWTFATEQPVVATLLVLATVTIVVICVRVVRYVRMR